MSSENYSYSHLELRLLHLYLLKEQIKYLHNPTESYFDSLVKESSFLFYCFFNARECFVLELNKLLCHKENNNIVTFISNLIRDYESVSWHRPIKKEILVGYRRRMAKLIKSPVIQIAFDLRNMHIAHDDLKKKQFTISLEISEAYTVLDSIMSIYNDIIFHLSNTTIMYKRGIIFTELQRLEAFKKIRSHIFDMRVEGHSHVAIDDIVDILSLK